MDLFDTCFTGLPELVDRADITESFAKLGSFYDVNRWQLPLPLWANRPYDFSGADAWQEVQSEIRASDPGRPFCLYLHIPFCTSKCGFCDSYSFKLAARVEEHATRYLDLLCGELALWSRIDPLSGRPVSTVHLGGGTPAFIGERGLARLVDTIRQRFSVDDSTEWALETTVESLTPGMIAALERLGFTRLHLGIQTLEDDSRRLIGRRRPAGEALAIAAEMRSRGWIVSVDLIAGLPGQTLAGYMGGISDLVAAGVDGFSLYELLIYPQNRRWAESHGLVDRDHLPNALMFAAGAALLEARGFKKNLFNHWANDRDANVYFTFPQRGDDLLAIGTIADGVFGGVHYRHPRYAPYTMAEPPGLEGGLRRTAFEDRLKPLVTALLAGALQVPFLDQLKGRRLAALLARWAACGLIASDGKGMALTSTGSWFTGTMIAELTRALGAEVSREKGDHV